MASGSAPAAVPLPVPVTKTSCATRERRSDGLTLGPSSAYGMRVTTAPSTISPSSTERVPVTEVGYEATGLALNSTGRSAMTNDPVRFRGGSLGILSRPNAAFSRWISGTSTRSSVKSRGTVTSSPPGVTPCPAPMESCVGARPRCTYSPSTTPKPPARPRSAWRVRK